ncbi:MAG TPA: NGG1p interacting factor NIF3 [Patescibacteria group bacterium]|nr:NGG1p interacting factor NIF3 [Patescibacteria group bacterium]
MMTVQQIFDLGIKLGIAADPRGAKGVKKYLDRVKRDYNDLKPSDKEYFDVENLKNPYPDSRVHVNDGKTKVKRVLAGIDITASDIILASQLSERGKKIDLAIAHHPVGMALANLHEVMEMGISMYEAEGVPVHLAEKIMEERMNEVGRSLHPVNHYREVSVAELLGVNFMNTHTITDNLVDKFVGDYLKKRKPETIKDLMDALMELPEYQIAKRLGSGPKIYAGSPSHRVGKFLVEMTGGTEPSAKIYQEYSRSGISTIVGMHMRKETVDKANESQLNIVTAGHMSSDSLGMNLFLDELEKRGVEIVPCGGLIRVSRNKKKN